MKVGDRVQLTAIAKLHFTTIQRQRNRSGTVARRDGSEDPVGWPEWRPDVEPGVHRRSARHFEFGEAKRWRYGLDWRQGGSRANN